MTAAAALSGETLAAVPAAVARHTVRAAVYAVRGAGELPAPILALVGLATRAAILSRLRIAASALGLAVAGAALASRWTVGAGRGPSPTATATSERPPSPAVAADPAPGSLALPSSAPVPDSGRRAPANLATFHEEAERPEEDLGAAILKELGYKGSN